MTEPSTRVLLVEDDPVSGAFLRAALERLPARVDIATTCGRARTLARSGAYALWLVDAHLPDGRGDALLTGLRAEGFNTVAIAHTAAREADQHERLLQAGFMEVLVKPLSGSEILAAARQALGMLAPTARATAPSEHAPVWDDASALDALMGNRTHLQALRRLFLPDLRAMRVALSAAVANDDAATLRSVLHRLRASCSFVGAARLAASVNRLVEGDAATEWPAFDAIVAQTLAQAPLDDA